MRRFSVRALMVLIVGTAVGLAAFRSANVFWASAYGHFSRRRGTQRSSRNSPRSGPKLQCSMK